MNTLWTIIKQIFVQCTDFVINLSNFFNLSYYEINFIIFCVIYPTAIVGSIVLYIVQKNRLKKLNT